MIYLTPEEVLFMNTAIINKISPAEPKGCRDWGLLQSAVARPQATFNGIEAYPTLFGKAAALMESLSQNHTFHNANKRTALAATITFLKLNGYDLLLHHDNAVQYALDVTTGIVDLESSENYLKLNSKPR